MARPRKVVQQYNDETVVLALSLYNLYGSTAKVAKELSIPKGTVDDWVHGRGRRTDRIMDFQRQAETANTRMLEATVFVMSEALQQVHKRIGEASAAQAATIYGILFDKTQILLHGREQQNTNVYVDTSGMSDDAKLELMQRALDRKKEMEIIEATQED